MVEKNRMGKYLKEEYKNNLQYSFLQPVKPGEDQENKIDNNDKGVPYAELTDNAKLIIEKRYLRRDKEGNFIEDHQDLFQRVANSISLGESKTKRQTWRNECLELLTSLKFLPNSPTLVNAGTDKGCLSACFVVSPDDTMDSIMSVAYDAAMIEKWGGGIGFGFSQLRPVNDKISTTHGMACGPIAVMKLYSSVGATLTQGSFRLGAHMGQLRDSHPDIKEFIHCKDGDDTLSNFNISVQITDKFMQAVEKDKPWDLINPRDGKVVEQISAKELWNEISESAWKTGDPGVVFVDRVWETAPNPQMGQIETSNPCGEEFLENYGNCCLGSINLDLHIRDNDFDWESLEKTVRTSVRFLDNVIEVNNFPLPQLREVNLKTRRIGLGVMGWADSLMRLNMPYDSDEALKLAEKLGEFLNRIAWDESRILAEERGPFPEYENSALKERGMPPVRNSSVLTIAPTGTISRIAGCSSGIEPHFAIAWWSNVLWEDQEGTSSRLLDAPTSVWEKLRDALKNEELVREVLTQIADNPNDAKTILDKHGIDSAIFRTSMGISPEAHIRMQSIWQKYVTNSVSKTINLPNEATVEDIKNSYELAWETGCKAVTVYRDGSKSLQVLETGKNKINEESNDELDNGNILLPRHRPTVVNGLTERIRSGHGTMFVTVNFDQKGNPFEVFSTSGRSGGCEAAHLDGLSRLTSLALRSGVDPEQIVDQLKGTTCCPVWDGGNLIRSAEDAVAYVLGKRIGDTTDNELTLDTVDIKDDVAQLGIFPSDNLDSASGNKKLNSGARCPDCSGYMVFQEGCQSCPDCGYNKCE